MKSFCSNIRPYYALLQYLWDLPTNVDTLSKRSNLLLIQSPWDLKAINKADKSKSTRCFLYLLAMSLKTPENLIWTVLISQKLSKSQGGYELSCKFSFLEYNWYKSWNVIDSASSTSFKQCFPNQLCRKCIETTHLYDYG